MAARSTEDDQSKLFVPVQRRFAAGFGVLAFFFTFAISVLIVDDLLTITLRAMLAFLLFAILGYLTGLLVMFSSDPRVLTEQEFLAQLQEQEAIRQKREDEADQETYDDQALTFIGGVMPGSVQVEE
jgi:hypothetical protein